MAERAVSVVSYSTGVTTAGVGVWTLNEWALIIGICATIGTFIVNFVFKYFHYQLAKKEIKKD